MNDVYINREVQKRIHFDWFKYKLWFQGKKKLENKKGDK